MSGNHAWPGTGRTVDVVIDDPATRARIGHLVSQTLHRENVERLLATMNALAAEAERRGLTDEILEE